MKLHDCLFTLRGACKISQAGLAKKLKMSQAALAGIEKGRSNPRLHTLIRIGRELNFRVLLCADVGAFTMSAVGNEIELTPTAARILDERLQRELAVLTPLQIEIAVKIARVLGEDIPSKR